MNTTIYIKSYKAPDVDVREALRYAGMRAEDEAVERELIAAYAEAMPVLSYRVCYVRLDVDAPFVRRLIESSVSARERLCEARSVIVFLATVGVGIDRLIARAAVGSPARALLFDAIGAERVEALCDEFCREMAKECAQKSITRRFSPGYGDISLEFQRDIFELLDGHRSIGVALCDSLLMSPSKSVSAIIGVK